MTSSPRKRGVGRPPLPDDEVRSARFLLRLRPDELAKLKKLAAGETVGLRPDPFVDPHAAWLAASAPSRVTEHSLVSADFPRLSFVSIRRASASVQGLRRDASDDAVTVRIGEVTHVGQGRQVGVVSVWS